MRVDAIVVVFVILGLSGCNRDSSPPLKPDPRPAPIVSSSVVNPPLLDTPRVNVTEMRTIPPGSTIQIRNNEAISLQTAELGQTFPGTVERDVRDNKGLVAIPRGSEATLVVLRIGAKQERELDIGGVVVAGRRYGLEGQKRAGASAKAENIAAATLMSFELEGPAQIHELR
jgi:hypothetical protein